MEEEGAAGGTGESCGWEVVHYRDAGVGRQGPP